MNRRNGIRMLASGALLMVSCSLTTPRDSSTPSGRDAPAGTATIGVSRGSIISIDDRQLVLAHKRSDGTSEELMFVLNPETARRGSLMVGSKVAVHYTMRDNERVVTSVQPMPRIAPSSGKETL